MEQCVDILAVYRRNCASASSSGQLILPESLKLLPLFCLSLTKSTALRAGSDVRIDERAARVAQGLRLSVGACLSAIYPTLYALPLDGAPPCLPPPTVALCADKLSPQGAYLLDGGLELLLWLGPQLDPNACHALVGAPSLKGLDCAQLQLMPPESSQLAATVRARARPSREGRLRAPPHHRAPTLTPARRARRAAAFVRAGARGDPLARLAARRPLPARADRLGRGQPRGTLFGHADGGPLAGRDELRRVPLPRAPPDPGQAQLSKRRD